MEIKYELLDKLCCETIPLFRRRKRVQLLIVIDVDRGQSLSHLIDIHQRPILDVSRMALHTLTATIQHVTIGRSRDEGGLCLSRCTDKLG